MFSRLACLKAWKLWSCRKWTPEWGKKRSVLTVTVNDWLAKIQPEIRACYCKLNSNEYPVFLLCFFLFVLFFKLQIPTSVWLVNSAYFYVLDCSVCSPPRHCPVMSQRAHTHPPTSTGCTAGHQAAMWPRATTTGSRRARFCLTRAAGWACMPGRSIQQWPIGTKPAKVFIRIIYYYYCCCCCCCWITVLSSFSRTFSQ